MSFQDILDRISGPVTTSQRRIIYEIVAERERQHARWGEQNFPDGTGGPLRQEWANLARDRCDIAMRARTVTFAHVFEEEAAEALAEDDPVKLRAELLQVAATALQWIEAIDRRRGRT